MSEIISAGNITINNAFPEINNSVTLTNRTVDYGSNHTLLWDLLRRHAGFVTKDRIVLTTDEIEKQQRAIETANEQYEIADPEIKKLSQKQLYAYAASSDVIYRYKMIQMAQELVNEILRHQKTDRMLKLKDQQLTRDKEITFESAKVVAQDDLLNKLCTELVKNGFDDPQLLQSLRTDAIELAILAIAAYICKAATKSKDNEKSESKEKEKDKDEKHEKKESSDQSTYWFVATVRFYLVNIQGNAMWAATALIPPLSGYYYYFPGKLLSWKKPFHFVKALVKSWVLKCMAFGEWWVEMNRHRQSLVDAQGDEQSRGLLVDEDMFYDAEE